MELGHNHSTSIIGWHHHHATSKGDEGMLYHKHGGEPDHVHFFIHRYDPLDGERWVWGPANHRSSHG